MPLEHHEPVIAFAEDGVVRVFSSRDDVIREYEGIDVESDAVIFYDMRGTRLRAEFLKPNRRGKLLGLFPWVESGIYRLLPDLGPDADANELEIALAEATHLEPNPWFASLDDARHHFADRNAR